MSSQVTNVTWVKLYRLLTAHVVATLQPPSTILHGYTCCVVLGGFCVNQDAPFRALGCYDKVALLLRGPRGSIGSVIPKWRWKPRCLSHPQSGSGSPSLPIWSSRYLCYYVPSRDSVVLCGFIVLLWRTWYLRTNRDGIGFMFFSFVFRIILFLSADIFAYHLLQLWYKVCIIYVLGCW